MIYVDLRNSDFYDDAQVLIKSFYPRMQTSLLKDDSRLTDEDTVIYADTSMCEGVSKKEAHDRFKKNLYLKLQGDTGKNLPWGYLTGVRPSKIAYSMLEAGNSDEEIMSEFEEKHFVSHDKAELAMQVAKTEKKILEDIDYTNGYSIYIGIPFCPTTCLYCSFTSYSLAANRSKVDLYLDALVKEMRFVADRMKGRRLDTVYFGGGTPTTLEPEQLDRLLNELEADFDMSTVKELTVEAGRPDSVTVQKLEVLKKHGVDRISINPQTMNDKTLRVIGRAHTAQQVEEAYAMARTANIHHINMDVIAGLPGENIDDFARTMDAALRLKPESLTVHTLAIKRSSRLHLENAPLPDGETASRMVQLGLETAHRLGMKPYYLYRQKYMAGNQENVGYALPGHACQYNVDIMEETTHILALGAGGISKRVYPEEGHIGRAPNVSNIEQYIARVEEMIGRKKALFLPEMPL